MLRDVAIKDLYVSSALSKPFSSLSTIDDLTALDCNSSFLSSTQPLVTTIPTRSPSTVLKVQTFAFRRSTLSAGSSSLSTVFDALRIMDSAATIKAVTGYLDIQTNSDVAFTPNSGFIKSTRLICPSFEMISADGVGGSGNEIINNVATTEEMIVLYYVIDTFTGSSTKHHFLTATRFIPTKNAYPPISLASESSVVLPSFAASVPNSKITLFAHKDRLLQLSACLPSISISSVVGTCAASTVQSVSAFSTTACTASVRTDFNAVSFSEKCFNPSSTVLAVSQASFFSLIISSDVGASIDYLHIFTFRIECNVNKYIQRNKVTIQVGLHDELVFSHPYIPRFSSASFTQSVCSDSAKPLPLTALTNQVLLPADIDLNPSITCDANLTPVNGEKLFLCAPPGCPHYYTDPVTSAARSSFLLLSSTTILPPTSFIACPSNKIDYDPPTYKCIVDSSITAYSYGYTMEAQCLLKCTQESAFTFASSVANQALHNFPLSHATVRTTAAGLMDRSSVAIAEMVCVSPYFISDGSTAFNYSYKCAFDGNVDGYPVAVTTYDPCEVTCGSLYYPDYGLSRSVLLHASLRIVNDFFVPTARPELSTACDAGWKLIDSPPVHCLGVNATYAEWSHSPCTDVNECVVLGNEATCGVGGFCANTMGSFECGCSPEYQKFGNMPDGRPRCDLNECVLPFENPLASQCDDNAICVNTLGSYECHCRQGFFTAEDGSCEPSTCFDGAMTGDEEGVDCGGSCPMACIACPSPPSHTTSTYELVPPPKRKQRLTANFACKQVVGAKMKRVPDYAVGTCFRTGADAKWTPAVPPDCSISCPANSYPNVELTGCVQDEVAPILRCPASIDLWVDSVTGTAVVTNDHLANVTVVDETKTREMVAVNGSDANLYLLRSCPSNNCGVVPVGQAFVLISSEDSTGKKSSCKITLKVYPAGYVSPMTSVPGNTPVTPPVDMDECAFMLDKCDRKIMNCVDRLFADSGGRGYDCVMKNPALVFDYATQQPVLAPPVPGIDECAEKIHGCHRFAVCRKTVGQLGYSCICNDGYVGDGLNCDVNPVIALTEKIPLASNLGIEDVQTISKMSSSIFNELATLSTDKKVSESFQQSLVTRLLDSMSVTSSFSDVINSGSRPLFAPMSGGGGADPNNAPGASEKAKTALINVSSSQMSTVMQMTNLLATPRTTGGDSSAPVMASNIASSLIKTTTSFLSIQTSFFKDDALNQHQSTNHGAISVFTTMIKPECVAAIAPTIETMKSESGDGSDSVFLNTMVKDSLSTKESLSNSFTSSIAFQSMIHSKNSSSLANPGSFTADDLMPSGPPSNNTMKFGFAPADAVDAPLNLEKSGGWSAYLPPMTSQRGVSDCRKITAINVLYDRNIYSESALEGKDVAPGPMMSLDVYGLDCPGEKMKKISVGGVNKKKPIVVKMEIDNYDDTAVCGFYSSEEFKINYTGCLRVKSLDGPGYITCECTHLTDFGAMMKSVVMSTNLALLGRIGELKFDPRNYGFWMILALTIVAFLVIARAIYRDVKYPITNESLLLVYCNDKLILDRLRSEKEPQESMLDGYKKQLRIFVGKDKTGDVDEAVKSLQVVRNVVKQYAEDTDPSQDKQQFIQKTVTSALQVSRDTKHAEMSKAVTTISRFWRNKMRQRRLRELAEQPQDEANTVREEENEKTANPKNPFHWQTLFNDREVPFESRTAQLHEKFFVDDSLTSSFSSSEFSEDEDRDEPSSVPQSLSTREEHISSSISVPLSQTRKMTRHLDVALPTSILMEEEDHPFAFQSQSDFDYADSDCANRYVKSNEQELKLNKRSERKQQQIQNAIDYVDPSIKTVSDKMVFASWSLPKLFQKTLTREHPIAGQEIGFRRSSVELALKYGSALLGGLFLMACFYGVDETPVPPDVEGFKSEHVVEPDVPLVVIPVPFSLSFMGPFDFTGINITLKGLLTSIFTWILGQMIPFFVDMLFNVETPYVERLQEHCETLGFSIHPKTGLIPVTLISDVEIHKFLKRKKRRAILGMVLGSIYSLFCLFFLFIFVLALGAGFENDERWKQTSDFFISAFLTNFIELCLWPLFMAFLITFLIKAIFSKTNKFDQILKLRPGWVQFEDFDAAPRDCRTAQFKDVSIDDVVSGTDRVAFAKISS
eukprot:GDKJ01016665.1.p1 GENE.GDKJ01016665.1~~GDKJ01016665.1.p1  ORF type:complete len:2139 (+),score=535.94 GDKJ01016665.1:1642-8058(+)